LHITTSDFFTKNPAVDVLSNKDVISELVMDAAKGIALHSVTQRLAVNDRIINE
jgi:hypothetical protein